MEYYLIFKRLNREFELYIIATGSHLSKNLDILLIK